MAEQIIRMRPEGANDYGDIVYPQTKANAVIDLDRFGSASGTNAYTVTIGSVPQLYTGLRVTVAFTNANTTASTLNVNGLGAKSIIKAGGASLSSGNIKAGSIQTLVYNGTSFQLLGEGGEYGTAQASHVLAPYTVGTENGIITGTIPTATTVSPFEQSSELYVSPGVVYLKTNGAKYFPNATWLKFDEPNLVSANIKSGVTIGSTTKLTGTFTGVGTASASHVLSGMTYSNNSVMGATGTMVNRGAVTSTLSTQGGVYTIPAGYHSGTGKVTASFGNLSAANIKSGVNIGGVVGTLKPIGTASVTSTTVVGTSDTVINLGGRTFVSVVISTEVVPTTSGYSPSVFMDYFISSGQKSHRLPGTSGTQGVADIYCTISSDKVVLKKTLPSGGYGYINYRAIVTSM